MSSLAVILLYLLAKTVAGKIAGLSNTGYLSDCRGY